MIICIGDEEFEVEGLLKMTRADVGSLEQKILTLAELLVKKRKVADMLESLSRE
jgi:hypothetical protein